MKRLPAVLLAANVLYLIAVRSIAGRFVSVVGCLVALALLVGPRVSRRFAARVEEAFQTSSGRTALPAAVAFALPAISCVRQFTLGFWRVDAAAWLIVAWLITLVWLAIAQTAGDPLRAGRRASTTTAAHAALHWDGRRSSG